MNTDDNSLYLQHYGVLGMKWGKRKDKYDGLSKKDYKDRKKLNKKIAKESRKTYRSNDYRVRNRSKVNSEFQKAFQKDKNIINSWNKAITNYHKTGNEKQYKKDLRKYKVAVNKLSDSFVPKQVDAFLKDVGMTKISDINKQYLADRYRNKMSTT